jgi:hypothetical protein
MIEAIPSMMADFSEARVKYSGSPHHQEMSVIEQNVSQQIVSQPQ